MKAVIEFLNYQYPHRPNEELYVVKTPIRQKVQNSPTKICLSIQQNALTLNIETQITVSPGPDGDLTPLGTPH